MRWREIESKVNSIDGWLLPGQAQWLFETAQSLPDESVILEVGGYLGHSTAALAYGCVGTSKHVFCVDTFCGNDTDFIDGKQFTGERFLWRWNDNLSRCSLLDYVSAMIGTSRSYYDKWTAKIDMLFIDGSHQYQDVLGDLCNFSKHVVPGGIVAMHDVTPLAPWQGPYQVWCKMSGTLLEETHVTCGTLAYGFRRHEC
jgi:hypothetical protein